MYDVRIGGGREVHGKAEVVREVAQISSKCGQRGRESKNPNILRTSLMEALLLSSALTELVS